MKIIKRDKSTFDSEFIELMEKKYPKCDKRTNTQYKRNLDYIALNTDFYETDEVDTMLEKGYDVILFYQYIRTRIGASEDGYKYEVTGKKLNKLLDNTGYYLKISKERAKEIYDFLVLEQIFIEVDYNNGKWLLDEYSVWNFEIINTTRVSSRKASAKSRKNQQAKDQQEDDFVPFGDMNDGLPFD